MISFRRGSFRDMKNAEHAEFSGLVIVQKQLVQFGSGWLRVFRLFRVFRVFQSLRGSSPQKNPI
jgi:hypothetical protein